MLFLSLFSFSFLCVGVPCMCSMLARCVCKACKCDCILLPALLPIEKSNRKLERPAFSGPGFAQGNRVHWLCGQPGANLTGARAAFSSFPRPGVCVPKPNSLAFRVVVRKHGRLPGRIFQFPRPVVCVPKPNSLAFRVVVRKHGRPPSRHSQFFWPAVCVPKTNSLAFRGVVRKPGRPPGRIFLFYRRPGCRRAAFPSFPGPHPNNEETEGARLRFLFFPIIPGFGRMLPAGRSELPCTRHRSRCRCSPLPLHWHRS